MFSLSDQPQEFFKVLRDANRLFFASFTTAFPVALLGNVFMLTLFALFAVPALLSASSNEGTRNNTLWLLPMCATLVFYPAAMSSVLISVHGIADAQPVKLSQALKRGFRRFFSMYHRCRYFFGVGQHWVFTASCSGNYLFFQSEFLVGRSRSGRARCSHCNQVKPPAGIGKLVADRYRLVQYHRVVYGFL